MHRLLSYLVRLVEFSPREQGIPSAQAQFSNMNPLHGWPMREAMNGYATVSSDE